MLKTLGKVSFKDLKINEVFAYYGCWQIFIKISNKEGRLIATNEQEDYENLGETIEFYSDEENIYKLPLQVQRFWKEE